MLLFLLGGAAGLAIARVMTTLLVSLLPTLPLPVGVTLLARRARACLHGRSFARRRRAVGPGAGAARSRRPKWSPRSRPMGEEGPTVCACATRSSSAKWRSASCSSSARGFRPRAAARDRDRSRIRPARRRARGARSVARRLYRRDRPRLRARPDPTGARAAGVQSATLAAMLPLGGGGLGLGGLTVPGVQPPDGARFFDADWNIVDPWLPRRDEDDAGVRPRLHRRRSGRHAAV